MFSLEINATIASTKLHEFRQVKMTFINKLQHISGYSGFTEKPGSEFNMRISWTTKKALETFMKTDLFHFFHGALITLSEPNKDCHVNLGTGLKTNK